MIVQYFIVAAIVIVVIAWQFASYRANEKRIGRIKHLFPEQNNSVVVKANDTTTIYNEDASGEFKETLEDISAYDIIYIGFPNWWGTLPMPMFTQLESLDFTGKVVKAFVTHEGSGFGSSKKDIAKLCLGAEIKNGLSIPGADVYDVKDTVKAWVDE